MREEVAEVMWFDVIENSPVGGCCGIDLVMVPDSLRYCRGVVLSQSG